ncbi:bactofilin family protein [Treponema pedis]|uniref:Polymer-forming cytoskeletal protein n=1 Tax=Treponema pedis TaxID=409322 RepID=A0A7S6WPG8_9SPIR|nr:polymer-forming cytoskeletal protein [Treponema pedis]QOW60837.1 polymer-forming cytoskeletal protein [Treponema pedis]QSI04116.1 polymer-forming cytoskeletal family protein [Treponema pedis]
MAGFVDDVSVNTIIGPGSFINGSLRVPGFLRIDGDIDGDIDTPGRVIIAEHARVRGNIHASSISIGGMVQGDVIAPNGVVILSTGLVLGSILTKKIRVDEDVFLHGFCFAVNNQAEFDRVEKEYKNKQGLAASALLNSR